MRQKKTENQINNPVKKRLSCLPPTTGNDCCILILGSLPGNVSLSQQAYYAHPRNHFWPIMGSILRIPDFAKLDYDERLIRLKQNRIGLWDVVSEAERTGSLDQNLREISLNPLMQLIKSLPQLQILAFNGQTAARLGRKIIKNPHNFLLFDLPSTSPANTMPFEQKLVLWQNIFRTWTEHN